MPKSKTFRVMDGRMIFKCPCCQYRRMIAVAPGLRRRLVSCQGCGKKISCILNRRQIERTSQSGRVYVLAGGSQNEADLSDISAQGVGFEMDARSGLKIAVGREIEFKCTWNPRLLNHGRYVVRSVRGTRVGAEWRR
jgi:PilZ domain